MAMSTSDDIKKQIKKQDDQVYGDDIANDPESDDDTDEMFKKFVGHKPKKGENIADEVDEAEKARRGVQPHEEEKEK